MLPKVSILIPTFNQEGLIGQCIASALAQRYGNLEVVVSDDASQDGTEDAVRRFLTDPRLRYHRNAARIGRVANYRRLLNALAAGDWVLMLDGDDYLVDRDYMAKAMAVALSGPDVVLVFGKMLQGRSEADATLWNDGLGLPETMSGDAFFLAHPPFVDAMPFHLTCLYRRTPAIECEFYRYDIVSTDFESLYRLMLGHQVGFVDTVGGFWRQHEANTSKAPSYAAAIDNFRTLTGPRDWATATGRFPPAVLSRWFRRAAAGYLLASVNRMAAAGHTGDVARIVAFAARLDPMTLGHAGMRVGRAAARRLGIQARSRRASTR